MIDTRIPPDWITAALDPVRRVGRAVARSWSQDPEDGEGTALLSLCVLADSEGEWESLEHFIGTAVIAARRAVHKSCKREQGPGLRVYVPVEEVATSEPTPPETGEVRQQVERVLDRCGLPGLVWSELVLEGRTRKQVAERYNLTGSAIQRAMVCVTDQLRIALAE